MMWRLKSIFFIKRQICNIIWTRVSQHLGHLEMRGRKYYALMLEASMEIPHFCIIQILYFLEEWDYIIKNGLVMSLRGKKDLVVLASAILFSFHIKKIILSLFSIFC